jgi:DNA-binding GntR family transcriptional regulator
VISDTGPPTTSGYQLCLDELTRLIRVGVLRPGEQIRQDRIATELSVSRTPVRQALQSLAADGLVKLVPNTGFFVADLTIDELSEIYWMREVMEKRLYETVVLEALDLTHLWKTEAELEAAIDGVDMHEVGRLTQELQFEIFAASPLATVRNFVSRLWLLSESYRAMQRVVYLADADSRERRKRQHREVIEALSRGDYAQAITVVNTRRNSTIDVIKVLLSIRQRH